MKITVSTRSVDNAGVDNVGVDNAGVDNAWVDISFNKTNYAIRLLPIYPMYIFFSLKIRTLGY